MNIAESLTHSLFADSKAQVTKQAVLYCIGRTASPSAILVRSTKPSPNQFARIRETGFRFNKSTVRNCKILNRFKTGLTNQLCPKDEVQFVTLCAFSTSTKFEDHALTHLLFSMTSYLAKI